MAISVENKMSFRTRVNFNDMMSGKELTIDMGDTFSHFTNYIDMGDISPHFT